MNTDIIQEAVLALMLISMMFAMGLKLTPYALVGVLRERKLVAATLVMNFALLPLVALALVMVLRLPAGEASGVLLTAAAPGATMTTLLSRNARADVPAAVGLLLLLVCLSVFLTPLLASTLFAAASLADVTLRAPGAIFSLVAYQLLPLMLGMWVRKQNVVRADAMEPVIARIATVILITVIVGFTIAKASLIPEMGIRVVSVILVYVLISTAVGLLWGRTRKLKVASSFATGAQNIALATLLAERYLDERGLMAVLLFGLLTYLVLLPLVPFFRRFIDQPAAQTGHG